MSKKTAIEWTDATWNPVTGCTKVSQGCKNCYVKPVTSISALLICALIVGDYKLFYRVIKSEFYYELHIILGKIMDKMYYEDDAQNFIYYDIASRRLLWRAIEQLSKRHAINYSLVCLKK